MNIDRQNESSLLIALTEALQGAKVRSWPWVSFPEGWEVAAQQLLDDKFRKNFYKHLDNGGLESLVRDYLLKKMIENGVPFPEETASEPYPTKLITSYSEFSDPLALSREIVEYISKGPYSYVVCVSAFLNAGEVFGDDLDIAISERFRLVSASKVPKEFSTRSSNKSLNEYIYRLRSGKTDATEIETGNFYFIYRTTGYLTDRTRSACYSDMYDDIRAFYGASIAFDIVSYHSFFRLDKSVHVICNSLNEGVYRLESVEEAEEDVHDSSQVLLTQRGVDLFKSGSSFEEIFRPAIRLFRSAESQRLKTSAIWLLRSFLSERGMDTILDATIAIEVLLGDRDASDRIGLSKLMANRCAYALGKSAKEREDLYSFFLSFYKMRSEIVHSGRLKISDSESAMVEKGVKLASRILLHEVEMN